MASVVYVYYPATAKSAVYGIVDMQGPEPGDEEECAALASEIREQHPTARVMVVPFGEYKSTANQFVVKAEGHVETTKEASLLYFGPFANKQGAEAAAAQLRTVGGEDPDLGELPTCTVLEVTAAELALLQPQPQPLGE